MVSIQTRVESRPLNLSNGSQNGRPRASGTPCRGEVHKEQSGDAKIESHSDKEQSWPVNNRADHLEEQGRRARKVWAVSTAPDPEGLKKQRGCRVKREFPGNIDSQV